MKKPLSDLACRLLTCLPPSPLGVRQSELRADMQADLGVPVTRIAEALGEIESHFGLDRTHRPVVLGGPDVLLYGLPAKGWKAAQRVAETWWNLNMAVPAETKEN